MNLPTTISDHPFLDTNNKQHFISLVPPPIRKAIYEIPHDWFEWDEKKIMAQVYRGEFPDDDYTLRLSFWEEYESCFESCTPMRTKNIVAGIMSHQAFNKNVLGSPGRVLFMITEPSYYKKRQKLVHHLLLNKVFEISKSEIKTDQRTGLPDTKMMDLQLKAYQYIDQRLHGSFIQKTEISSRNLNVNVDATPKAIPNNIEDIDKRIAEMEQELSDPNTELIGSSHEPLTPLDAVHKEAGRVMDAEFLDLDPNRDNSHREPENG